MCHTRLVALVFVAGSFTALGTQAAPLQGSTGIFPGLKPVSEHRLAKLRGGFRGHDFGFNLQFKMDFHKETFFNGSSTPHSPDITTSDNTVKVIQNGPNNTIDLTTLSIPKHSVTTVIQNSMNNQTIRTVNTLNISVASRTLAHEISIHQALQRALDYRH